MKSRRASNCYCRKDIKAFYEDIKEIYGTQKRESSPVLTSDGSTLLTDKSDMLNCWEEHCERDLNSSSDVDLNVIESILLKPEIPEIDFHSTHA
uniref:Uncharacterized protein n=1 Tax=Octopus bimaculoides TaxID=37653 RepID=A0A0L8I3V3_OCTBM